MGRVGQLRPLLASQIPAANGPAVAIQRPSALKATSSTPPEWIRSSATWFPVRTFQTRASRSVLDVTRRDPSGLKASEVRAAVCPVSVYSPRPVRPSQTRAVQSEEAVATCLPSGEKAAATTSPAWPLRALTSVPSTRQRNATPSFPTPTRSLPSGLNRTSFTGAPSLSSRSSFPAGTLHNRTHPSRPPVAASFPLGLKRAVGTGLPCSSLATTVPSVRHTPAVPSRLPVITSRLFLLNDAVSIEAAWRRVSELSSVCQRWAFPSVPALSMSFPSGLYATALTSPA